MKVVLDTNVFLVGLLPKHRYGWVFDQLQAQQYQLFVSNDILLEYQEKLPLKYGLTFSENVLRRLLDFRNVTLVDPHFHWNLITRDPDDNKFVDCALSAGADFIVSNDRHFNVLATIDFPKIEVIRIEAFGQRLGISMQ